MKRGPRPLHPIGVQLAYYAELRALVYRARGLVRARLVTKLPELLESVSELHDGAGGLFRPDAGGRDECPAGGLFRSSRVDARAPDVNRIMGQIAAALWGAFPQERLERIAARYARATSEHQRDQLFNQLKGVAGIDLGGIMDRRVGPAVKQFVAENVALIRTVPTDYFQDVEREVLRGMKAGDRASEIETALEERAGVARNRSALIARDQVLSFQADLNRLRQTNLGISRYVWRGADDGRERDEHVENNDQVFEWANPPGDPADPHVGTHPGTGILCRCYADPVIDDLTDPAESS